MAEHYEVHLIHPLQMLESEVLPEWADSLTRLHFELGAQGWEMKSTAASVAFSNAETNIVVPSGNVALLQVWED